MNQRKAFPTLSNNARSRSTTPLDRPRSTLSSSASIHRINLRSSCSNNVLPCNLPLKKLKPEPWQKFFDGEKRQVYSQQGFTVKRSKQSIDTFIHEEFFNLPTEQTKSDDSSRGPMLPAAIQAHIDQLSEHIDDLVVQLAEERLNHRQTKTKAEETLRNQLDTQSKQFQELLHHKMLEHGREIEELNDKHEKGLQDEKLQNEQREMRLIEEIETLKTSFHSYRISLERENEELFDLKVQEALEKMRIEFQAKEEEIHKRANEVIMKERKNIQARQKMEIDNIRKQHQKEIETIHSSFADSAFDRTRIETLTKELTATKIELDENKESVANLTTKLKELGTEHDETKQELREFRTRFDDKVKQIEKLYANRLDQLHLENADLRNMYMKKCAELVEERALTQQKIYEQVNLTKKQLKRKLLNIRIASSISFDTDTEPRRLSTCATASQFERSPTRCRSALSTSHQVEEIEVNDHDVTDFTIDNTRRETKLRRRPSLPITEEEHDVIRYLKSTSTLRRSGSTASKYDFESEPTMIKNLSLEDLQNTFKPQ